MHFNIITLCHLCLSPLLWADTHDLAGENCPFLAFACTTGHMTVIDSSGSPLLLWKLALCKWSMSLVTPTLAWKAALFGALPWVSENNLPGCIVQLCWSSCSLFL
jgi:hypothetical protein